MIKKIQNLPKGPGVYFFKKGKETLYIGKAINIKERVKQHKDLISLATKVAFIKTGSEIEALILEANLIKKYRPKYNVVWKDDKNYFYVGVTKEDFPRIFITHQIKSQNTKYKILNTKFIGPFVDGNALKQTLKVLRKVFPYRSCNNIPKHSCLWYHLNRCPAPCLLKSPLSQQIDGFRKSIIEESRRNTKNLTEVLRGKKVGVLKDLKKEMKKNSAVQDFEKAAETRDQIEALEKVLSHSRIFEMPQVQKEVKNTKEILKSILKTKKEINRIEAYDISNIQGEAATGSMVTFINGVPDKNFYRKFKISGKFTPYRTKGSGAGPNDVAMIKEVLERRFKHPEWPLPDAILVDGGKAQFNAALQVLKKYQLFESEDSSESERHQSAKSASISVLALAKKKNELFVENQKKPILLKTLPREIFNLVLQLRDEAHRFAKKYHHKLRQIDTFG